MKVLVHTESTSSMSCMDALEALHPESTKRIDWNAADRKWLMNHLYWALANGRAVIILPESN